jgi:hypothetical protein
MDENIKNQQNISSSLRVEPIGIRSQTPAQVFGPDKPPPRSAGRPKGSPNKVGSDLKTMILQVALETGFIRKNEVGEMVGTGEEGIKGYLKWVAIKEPRSFIGPLSRVLPLNTTVDLTPKMLTRAEVEAEFKERGLLMGLLESLRVSPVRLDDDEDPDPYRLKTIDATPDDAAK